jgi:plastocyanin
VDDESFVVTDGRLANVVLVVKGAPPPPPTTVTLDQERCRYRPHVLAVPIGSTLEIGNADELLHSVHGWAGRITRFDVVTPSKGTRVPTRLAKAGVIQVRCDVHAWMSAVVVVADGPAAVTSRDGAFEIRDLPAGTYTITAWHERLGEKSAEVTVPARGPARLDLTFGP